MGTKAFDAVTIFHALQTLEREFLGPGRIWHNANPIQASLFRAYRESQAYLDRLKDLNAKASTEWMELNDFLASEKFAPMFDGPLNGIGVVSILDKLVKWLEAGTACQIRAGEQLFPGFELGHPNFRTYRLANVETPLVEMVTQSGDNLFLLQTERDLSGIELFEFALQVMQVKQAVANGYAAVQIPKVDFDLKPDISFLVGASTTDQYCDDWFVAQARQQFKFRMNELGARAKVATGVGMMRCMVREEPKKLVFDRPFLGWFVQQGIEVPLAVFYADRDSWREPAGSLEDL